MERILLIEDDQALGRGIALALAGEGREIRVAATLEMCIRDSATCAQTSPNR